jgi:hypothetical protein
MCIGFDIINRLWLAVYEKIGKIVKNGKLASSFSVSPSYFASPRSLPR